MNKPQPELGFGIACKAGESTLINSCPDNTKPSPKEHASTDNSVGRCLPYAGGQLQ